MRGTLRIDLSLLPVEYRKPEVTVRLLDFQRGLSEKPLTLEQAGTLIRCFLPGPEDDALAAALVGALRIDGRGPFSGFESSRCLSEASRDKAVGTARAILGGAIKAVDEGRCTPIDPTTDLGRKVFLLEFEKTAGEVSYLLFLNDLSEGDRLNHHFLRVAAPDKPVAYYELTGTQISAT
jgi:hypothetical protein